MIVISMLAALVFLALLTQAGVFALEKMYPPPGKIIKVAGGALHVLDRGPRDSSPAIVMVHGASSNLEAMRFPLGDMLAKSHRVIMIDRPGHGWSERDDLPNSLPATQARMIDEALGLLGVSNAILVVHSMAGALAPLMALDYPERVAGMVMLAPVTHSWTGGVGSYNDVLTTPVVGPLLAYTITLPIGWWITSAGARVVFAPQAMPDNYVDETATKLLLRPREFLANAWDLVTLKAAVQAQVARYPQIKVPCVLIHGDADKTVSVEIHSRLFAAAVPNSKLIVLPNVGHMVQNAAPELVMREIETMIAAGSSRPKAAMR